MQFEEARVTQSGCGGFLNPPGHPEHTQSVSSSGSIMALSGASKCEYFYPTFRAYVKTILDSWKPLPIDSQITIEWIHQVLGYFKSCYKNRDMKEPDCWYATHITIDGTRNPMEWINDHAGVHLIRKYYPEYIPAQKDFDQAKWGN